MHAATSSSVGIFCHRLQIYLTSNCTSHPPLEVAVWFNASVTYNSLYYNQLYFNKFKTIPTLKDRALIAVQQLELSSNLLYLLSYIYLSNH